MLGEVETARAGQKPSESNYCVDRRGFSEPSLGLIGRIRRAARTVPIVAVSASVLATLCLVQILAGSAVQATALAALGLAALGAVGFAGLRAHTALAARLDILAGALDSVPEAQVVVAADGRAIFANAAFQRLFPDKSEARLEQIERNLTTDPRAAEAFDRLSSPLAEDAQADATTAACDTCDGVAGGFRWSAAQLAGRPGYRLWSLRAVSDSNQTEAPPGDERLEAAAPVSRELFQRLFANAPVGVAVVDRFGRFIEANRAAGELFCASPQELVGGELNSLLNALLCQPISQIPPQQKSATMPIRRALCFF
jgi:PAS domain-containing protein